MNEIKSNKTQNGHNLLKVSGIALLALVVMMNVAGAEPFENITFVTTGPSFSPIITVTGNPTIQWIFGDGSTSNSVLHQLDQKIIYPHSDFKILFC